MTARKMIKRIAAILICAAMIVTMFPGCKYLVWGGDFVLKANRYTIQPNGSDSPTFYCYTSDGEEIKSGYKIYANGQYVRKGKVTLSYSGETVEVYAEYDGMRSNTVILTAKYTSDLPVIVIDVGKNKVNQYAESNGTFYLFENARNKATDFTVASNAAVTSDCTVKIRGQSSSLMYSKKQYKIHLTTETGENNNVSLLGMPAENDWIINGTYGDRTVMNNYLVYTLASQMDFSWAPRVRYCEAYITSDIDNMQSQEYLGLYVLMESIKVDSDRVDIKKGDKTTAANQIGYMFAKDKGEKLDGTNTLNTGYGSYELVYPKPQNASKEQKLYIADKIRQFETALYSDQFTDPGSGYRAYMNVDSYIDGILLTELTKNIDGIRLSSYFTLDVNGKITYGPVWDYDISLGNCNYSATSALTSGFTCIERRTQYVHDYAWVDRMMEDPWFRSRFVERYNMYRETVITDENIQGIIDSAYYEVIGAATRNAGRWPELFDGTSQIWPSPDKPKTYTTAVNSLKTWIHKRIVWLDNNLDKIK